MVATHAGVLARRATPARTAGVALFATLIASASTYAAEPTAHASYFDEANPIPVRISLDRIGIVLRPGPVAFLPPDYTDALGLTVIDTLPGRLFIARLPHTFGPLNLAKEARRAYLQDTALVARAGMVVTRVHSTRPHAPMVATDEFVAQFRASVSQAQMDSLNGHHAVQVVSVNRYVPNQMVLRVTEGSGDHAVEMSRLYFLSSLVDFAHPNFTYVIEPASDPNDPLFGEQWHHRNDGSASGAVDADMDTDEAWAIQTGSSKIKIAVIDGGVDIHHEDFAGCFWENSGEAGGKPLFDDDANGYVDDVNGWNFYQCDLTGDIDGCGSLELDETRLASTDLHGTATAALVGAGGNNATGGVGVAYGTRLMLIRYPYTPAGMALAFDYARTEGADVITNSWRILPDNRPDAALRKAIERAIAQGREKNRGCVVLFAMSDEGVDDCQSCTGCPKSVFQVDGVVAVSASDNADRKSVQTGYGACMDLLAPANSSQRRVTTSDHTASAGYNITHASALNYWGPCPQTELGGSNYTRCFTGTSASTPLAAGVAGLVLSANEELTGEDVRYIVQDTADKIAAETGTSSAPIYAALNGYSTTHGWGRVNAYEAVRLASGSDCSGGGADIFVRDSAVDWGNTSHFVGYPDTWDPVDVKLDVEPFSIMPRQVESFDAFSSEVPSPGKKARVYLRFRNRSPTCKASESTLRIYGARYDSEIPALPADFWTNLETDGVSGADWRFLGKISYRNALGYGGASVAATSNQVVIDVALDASGNKDLALLESSAVLPTNFCVFAVLSSKDDPASPLDAAGGGSTSSMDPTSPKDVAIVDNNVTLRATHIP